MCKQIVRLQIGMGELLAFYTAVCEKAEMHNLSRERAAYLVIEDLHDYEKLGGMKKQLNDTIMSVQMVNLFLARQKYAVNAVMKLQL